MSQTQLGKAAVAFTLDGFTGPINKNTVSNVETWPFTCEFATIWRLLATLGLSLSDVQKHIKTPLQHVNRSESPPAVERKTVSDTRRKRPA